jgi:glycosyl transferase, family 25
LSKPEILVISLRAAEARRQLMRAQLDAPGLPPYRFIDGIDLRDAGEERLAEIYEDALASCRASGSLTRGEVGCACSHQAAYRYIRDRGLPAAVVLEDDCMLSHQFAAVLERVLAIVDLQKPRAVLFSHALRYSAWGATKVDRVHRLCRPYEAYGAHGYLITAAGAAAMLSAFPRVRTVADDWAYFVKAGALELSAVVPYVVGTSLLANHSQMPGPRWTAEPRNRAARWARRYLWRKFLFQLMIKPALRLHKQDVTW